MKIPTQNLGFPRIGAKRELKKALENFWAGKISQTELIATGKTIRQQNWQFQKSIGIDLIPSNDFSFYDHVLDTCALVGAVPERFHWGGDQVDFKTYFTMARGKASSVSECNSCNGSHAAAAMEMTKWFDTNYHYLVPEFHADQTFRLSSDKPFEEYSEAKGLGIATKPVLLSPISFLLLGKARGEQSSFDTLSLLPKLLPVYKQVLQKLTSLGASWLQMDEPILALDLTPQQLSAFPEVYAELRASAPDLKIMLATYFGDLRENLATACALPINALHIDFTRAPKELDRVLKILPKTVQLSAGIVDGRNIWKNDFSKSLELLREAEKKIGAERLIIAPSCSLLHCPVSLKYETKLDQELKSWFSFAEEKLQEVVALSRLLGGVSEKSDLTENAGWSAGFSLSQTREVGEKSELTENAKAITSRRNSLRIHNPAVKKRSAAVSAKDLKRQSSYSKRRKIQQKRLRLPLLPTTTIGSFPQTEEVRALRARFKKGQINAAEYERFLEEETRKTISLQEEIGIDVLVHGEFERNDMVEYFGEQLAGFAFTENGWVQSYGSRCVKPPVIFGDIDRPAPMTVRWSRLAQSLTRKPMKGMLTAPITILQWSFVRDDQPRSETARQIALAIRDEVRDLEAAGISIIQLDEPALREGLPLRKADRAEYLRWAVDAFRLAASSVKDETQIHTHMCYCEFDDIIEAIAELDADVISIETSRSGGELLNAFVEFKYPNEIGFGVWDIHSPRVPSDQEMRSLIEAALKVLPPECVWVNPDCGLKTRRWEEVIPSLKKPGRRSKRNARSPEPKRYNRSAELQLCAAPVEMSIRSIAGVKKSLLFGHSMIVAHAVCAKEHLALSMCVSESRRDSDSKPRVARNELPWENREKRKQPQRGCVYSHQPINH